jgi:putative FmdB family regulatory protein
MAIYTYRCRECGAEAEIWQSISEYSESPNVPHCVHGHGLMDRRITAPLVSFDTAPWAAYQSPIDGEIIDSRTKRNEHMAKHGVVMYDEIQPDIARNRKRIEDELKTDLKDSIIQATHMVESGHKPKVFTESEFNAPESSPV